MKVIHLNLVLISIVIFLISCNKKEFNECSSIICTTEFKIITTSITNKDSEIVILDSFKVIDSNTKEDITISESFYSLEFAKKTGQYPIVADGSIELNNKKKLIFIGYIDNKEVIRNTYVAEENCCGVNLISGNLNLTID